MVGVLLDLRTGDPIIGDDGDYVQVDDNYAFYQIIDNLLHCQTGSEVWNIYYGFDLESAIRLNSAGAPAEIIESLVADAIDPNKEQLIYKVDYLSAYRDEDNPQQMRIRLSVQSILGSIVSLEENVGEL